MSIATGTTNFRSWVSQFKIVQIANSGGIDGLEETGPPASGVELGIAVKQRQPATQTLIYPLVPQLIIRSRVRSFCCPLAQDGIGFGR